MPLLSSKQGALKYKKHNNVPVCISLADWEMNLLKRSGAGALIFWSFTPEMEEGQLRYLLEDFGEIISCENIYWNGTETKV